MVLALTFSHELPGSSVVLLTESSLFKRRYSSLCVMLKNYYCARNTEHDQRIPLRRQERKKIIQFLTSLYTKDNSRNVYALDTTNHYRPHALKGVDRKNVRAKNNRFSEPGYEYSVLCNLKETGWSVPISVNRVASHENKYTLGAQQVLDAHSCGDKDSITIGVGDAAYSNTGYIEPLYKEENIISITRDRKNRAVYNMFTGEQKAKGRKRYYGDKINLLQHQDSLNPSNVTKFHHISNSGKETEIVLSEYKNLLVRGRKQKSMKRNPVNYVKVEVHDTEGSKVYKNDLWICVSGKNRDMLTAKEVYHYYKSRFDIEHFFKFAKSKMRFDKLQTTKPEIDEDYCMFVMLAYNHLYHLKDNVNVTTQYDWYSKKLNNSSPSGIYRSLSEIKHSFQNITKPVIIRGIPDERNIRTSFVKQEYSPVITKSIQKDNIEISIKVPFGKSSKIAKTVFNANNFSPETFSTKISVLYDKISETLASNEM